MLNAQKILEEDEHYLYNAVKYDFLKIAMIHHGDLAYYSSDVKNLIKERIENLHETPSFQRIASDEELNDILEKQKEYFNEEIKAFEFPEKRKIVSYIPFSNVYEDDEAKGKEIIVKRDFVENFLTEKEIQVLRSFSYEDFSNYISHNFTYEHMEEYVFNEALSDKTPHLTINHDFNPERYIQTTLNNFMRSYFNGELIDHSSAKSSIKSLINEVINEISDRPNTFNPFIDENDKIKQDKIDEYKEQKLNQTIKQYINGDFADHSTVKYIITDLIKDTIIHIDNINDKPEGFLKDNNKSKPKMK